MCHPDQPAAPTSGVWAAMSDEASRVPYVVSGDEDRPSVLIVTDVFGDSAFHREVGARLVAAGYRAVLPDLFHRVGALAGASKEAAFARRALLDERDALHDLTSLAGALRSQGPLGVVGFCMGATLALDLTAEVADLVTVAFYGFPAPANADGRRAPAPLDRVERLRGPLLGLWGDRDETVGLESVHEFAGRLGELGTEHRFEIYPGLGHGFVGAAFGVDPDPTALEGWRAGVAFLDEHLGA
jgi:carboxymethylenebutenolidase